MLILNFNFCLIATDQLSMFPMHHHKSLVQTFRSNMPKPQTFETFNVSRPFGMLRFDHLFFTLCKIWTCTPLTKPHFLILFRSIPRSWRCENRFWSIQCCYASSETPFFLLSLYPYYKFYRILKEDIWLQLNNINNILHQPTNKPSFGLFLGFYQFTTYH